MLMMETQFKTTTVEKQLLKSIVTLQKLKRFRIVCVEFHKFQKPRGKMKVIIDI